MVFKNKVFFAPVNGNKIDTDNAIVTEFDTKQKLQKKDLVSKSINNVIDQEQLDPYALRNYWVLTGGFCQLKNKPWSNESELSDTINDDSITIKEGKNRIESVILISTESNEDAKTIRRNLKKSYGSNIPIFVDERLVHIQLKFTWTHNCSIQDLNKMNK